LKDVIITADAIHCQKKTFQCAEFVHAKLIIHVKDNQEELRKQIRYIIRVTRQRHLYKTQKEASNMVSYYVSNAALSAQEYEQYIREHLFIENKLLHIKDVSFQEDKQKNCATQLFIQHALIGL
jgi:predicted transposase YbfD/YdcC